MAQRSTQETLLISSGRAGKIRSTQESLLISVTAPIMAIAYPLSPPAIAGIGPQDVTLIEKNVVGESESPFTLSQQEQQWPGQQFLLEVNLPPLTVTEGEQWVSFLGALFGKLGTFLFGDYARPTPQGPWSGSPVIAGTNLNGTNILNLRGATASIANWAVAGDYLQATAAGQPQRLYKVLQNAASDGSGNVNLVVFPSLRETLVDGTSIVTANARGTWRLQDNQIKWEIDQNKMYKISFKGKEAL